MSDINDIRQTYKWLQEVSHDWEIPDGKCFIILTKGEYDNCNWKDNLHDEDMICTTYNYLVYGYDSYEVMVDTLDMM